MHDTHGPVGMPRNLAEMPPVLCRDSLPTTHCRDRRGLGQMEWNRMGWDGMGWMKTRFEDLRKTFFLVLSMYRSSN